MRTQKPTSKTSWRTDPLLTNNNNDASYQPLYLRTKSPSLAAANKARTPIAPRRGGPTSQSPSPATSASRTNRIAMGAGSRTNSPSASAPHTPRTSPMKHRSTPTSGKRPSVNPVREMGLPSSAGSSRLPSLAATPKDSHRSLGNMSGGTARLMPPPPVRGAADSVTPSRSARHASPRSSRFSESGVSEAASAAVAETIANLASPQRRMAETDKARMTLLERSSGKTPITHSSITPPPSPILRDAMSLRDVHCEDGRSPSSVASTSAVSPAPTARQLLRSLTKNGAVGLDEILSRGAVSKNDVLALLPTRLRPKSQIARGVSVEQLKKQQQQQHQSANNVKPTADKIAQQQQAQSSRTPTPAETPEMLSVDAPTDTLDDDETTEDFTLATSECEVAADPTPSKSVPNQVDQESQDQENAADESPSSSFLAPPPTPLRQIDDWTERHFATRRQTLLNKERAERRNVATEEHNEWMDKVIGRWAVDPPSPKMARQKALRGAHKRNLLETSFDGGESESLAVSQNTGGADSLAVSQNAAEGESQKDNNSAPRTSEREDTDGVKKAAPPSVTTTDAADISIWFNGLLRALTRAELAETSARVNVQDEERTARSQIEEAFATPVPPQKGDALLLKDLEKTADAFISNRRALLDEPMSPAFHRVNLSRSCCRQHKSFEESTEHEKVRLLLSSGLPWDEVQQQVALRPRSDEANAPRPYEEPSEVLQINAEFARPSQVRDYPPFAGGGVASASRKVDEITEEVDSLLLEALADHVIGATARQVVAEHLGLESENELL